MGRIKTIDLAYMVISILDIGRRREGHFTNLEYTKSQRTQRLGPRSQSRITSGELKGGARDC
jgi:hypothetical protein